MAFMQTSVPYLSWVGFRYWVSEAVSTADALHDSRRAARVPASPEPRHLRPTAVVPEVTTR
jgi:hypothetical protein